MHFLAVVLAFYWIVFCVHDFPLNENGPRYEATGHESRKRQEVTKSADEQAMY